MNGLKRLHRVLMTLQTRFWVKVIASVLCLAGCSAYFAPMLVTSYSYASDARGIAVAFTGPEGERFIRTLRETGSVKIDGEVRSIPEELAPTLFAEDGTLVDLSFTMFLNSKSKI